MWLNANNYTGIQWFYASKLLNNFKTTQNRKRVVESVKLEDISSTLIILLNFSKLNY